MELNEYANALCNRLHRPPCASKIFAEEDEETLVVASVGCIGHEMIHDAGGNVNKVFRVTHTSPFAAFDNTVWGN